MKTIEARWRRGRLRRQAGVTIVEALVAVSLLAIGVGAIGSFLSAQIRTASNSYLTSNAYALAEREFEDLRSLDYNSMVSRSSTKVMGNVTFTVTTTVIPDQPAVNVKTINVSVSWVENTGSKNVLVSSVYTQVHR